MPEKIIADVIENGNVLRITIPTKIAEYLGLKKGDRVSAWIEKLN